MNDSDPNLRDYRVSGSFFRLYLYWASMAVSWLRRSSRSRQWWTIFAHNKSTREKCEMWQIHEGDDYERIISEITNYLNKQ